MSKCPFHNSNPGNTFDISHYDPDIFDENRKVLIAQQLYSPSEEIVRASTKREWMDATPDSYAYRCLPLKMANEMGWHILSPSNIRMMWDGRDNVEIEQDNHEICSSHFGSGTITFGFRTIFRTSKGHCLYVKGPTNLPKQHIQPLEGLVETDWLTFTFTMNWKITTPNVWIEFKRDEPICHFFPYPKNYIEQFEPIRKDISRDGLNMFEHYNQYRHEFYGQPYTMQTERGREKWQKHYFRGEYPDSERTKCKEFGFQHDVKVNVKEFDDQRTKKENYKPQIKPPKKKSILFTR